MGLWRSLLAVLGIVTLFSTNVSATEYIIKFKTAKQFSASYASLQNFDGLKFKGFHPVGKIAKIELLANNKEELAKKLAVLMKRNDVEYVVENVKFYMFDAPATNDPKLSEQWALDKIGASKAWAHATGSANVVVAVIDTGVDTKHEDLSANIYTNAKEEDGNKVDDDKNGFVDDMHGWDFKDNDNNPMDATSAQGNPGHGTHCAGIIGAVGNNGVGISGISPHVSIMPLRFLGADGSGDLFSSTKAIDYAAQNGAQVISASWGAAVPQSSAQPIIDAIDRARQKGVIFVVASANDGTDNDSRPIFPANTNLDNVIAVAATDPNDAKPKWSNYGIRTVHLGSPGQDILSTLPKNQYGKLSGTSMATPLVAGLVALLKSMDPSIDGPAAKAILQATGADIGIEVACKCRIDAGKATDAVANKALTLIPAAATLKVGDKVKLGAYAGVAPFSFSSSDPSVAEVNAQGELVAMKDGNVTVTVKDAASHEAQSRLFQVSSAVSEPPAGECPFQDPFICLIMCTIKPDAEWCADLPPIPGMPGDELAR